jgi:hypothetical protein
MRELPAGTVTGAEWDAEFGTGRALGQEEAAALLRTLKE